MTLRIIGVALCAVSVVIGVAFSPAPWLALILVGAGAGTLLLLVDDGKPVDGAA